MADKKKTAKVKEDNDTLEVHMKMGILQTIAKSIYSGALGKIREAVANSRDNDANNFIVYLDKTTRTLSLFDDGTGISLEQFQEIFKSLGHGLLKDKKEAMSYFGLGLMSVIRLGSHATIYSRASNTKDIYKYSIEADKIFSEKNEAQDISFMQKCIKLTLSDLSSRSTNSPLSDSNIKSLLGNLPSSFTEIIIELETEKDVDMLSSLDFKEDLSKYLPLRIQDKEPFLEKINDLSKKKWIANLFKDDAYCPSLSIHYGTNEDHELSPLWRYFPAFKRNLIFGGSNVICGTSTNGKFKYFFVYTTEDLELQNKDSAETGFWIRSRNFLVKPADFLQQPGTKHKIVDKPLQNWLYGEIFHENMKAFLNVSRNDYIWESPEFIDFRESVKDIINELNRKLRTVWKSSSAIEEAIINPFLNMELPKGPFQKATTTISDMGINCEGEEADVILKKLSMNRAMELEKSPRIDLLIKNSASDKIVLANNENAIVTIDKTLDDETPYLKSINETMKEPRAEIRMSPILFSPKKVVFLSNKFDVYFVAGKQSNYGLSIDYDSKKIFVNPFNHDLMRYSLSFIDVYIAIELAHQIAKTKDEMKNYLLSLLGREFKSSEKYFAPLSDDLQRKSKRN